LKIQELRKILSIVKEFTWSELLSGNPGSGPTTKAGWISRAQTVAFRTEMMIMVVHGTHLILRIFTSSNNTLFFNTWIPFEGETKLMYILVVIMQVDLITCLCDLFILQISKQNYTTLP
jgi:hypothetical protein